ncbi:hypothetical protein [Aulosira sp. FACHB-615]|nr:hypothetical protein [Aulosira sp. FACHB-615]
MSKYQWLLLKERKNKFNQERIVYEFFTPQPLHQFTKLLIQITPLQL